MVTAYPFSITCPHCNGEVVKVAEGRKYHWQAAAAIKCTKCSWSGVVNITVSTSNEWAYNRRIDEATRKYRRDEQHDRAVERTRKLLAPRLELVGVE